MPKTHQENLKFLLDASVTLLSGRYRSRGLTRGCLWCGCWSSLADIRPRSWRLAPALEKRLGTVKGLLVRIKFLYGFWWIMDLEWFTWPFFHLVFLRIVSRSPFDHVLQLLFCQGRACRPGSHERSRLTRGEAPRINWWNWKLGIFVWSTDEI